MVVIVVGIGSTLWLMQSSSKSPIATPDAYSRSLFLGGVIARSCLANLAGVLLVVALVGL
ncbi:MAG: hypothetical protein ACE5EL_03480 [Anaerolineae bacterium]